MMNLMMMICLKAESALKLALFAETRSTFDRHMMIISIDAVRTHESMVSSSLERDIHMNSTIRKRRRRSTALSGIHSPLERNLYRSLKNDPPEVAGKQNHVFAAT
jgi:hypothetical protein